MLDLQPTADHSPARCTRSIACKQLATIARNKKSGHQAGTPSPIPLEALWTLCATQRHDESPR